MNAKPDIKNSTTNVLNNIQFKDIFILDEIQRLQDLFSDASGVASIITHPDGTPITNISNSCRLCNNIIRKTEKGQANCYHSDAIIGRQNPSGPIVQPCLSGGLWDAGASITIGGKHIANWLIGQVRNEELDEQRMIRYADEIGANREDFMEALNEVPVMSVEQFRKISKMLFAFANELSEKAYNNLQMKMQITESKQAGETFLNEQLLLRTVIDNIPDSIYCKDLACRKTLANLTELRYMGVKSEAEILGKDDFDFYPKELAEKFFADDQSVIKTGNPVINREEYILDEKEQKRWLLSSKLPLRDKDGQIIGLVGIGRDITIRKRAETEIKLKNEQLLKLIDEKDKFFSIIAHDLRSPFNSFLGLTQIMTEELPSLTMDEIQEIALTMRNSATDLFRLLENLLHWARIEQGLIPFHPEIIKLLPIVNESLATMLELAKNKKIEIAYDIPGETEVFADKNMLQTVIRNLVSNAVKFTPKGGKISLSAKASGDKSVEISIKDSGIGMNLAMVDNLFRLHDQTNRKGTEGEPSTGLGLIICKDFIEKHGGKLWVESEEGKGSTFHFTLTMGNSL